MPNNNFQIKVLHHPWNFFKGLENIVASLDRVKNEVLVLITRFSNHEQRLQQLEDIANISKIPARQLTPLEHNISLELDQGVNPLPTRDSIDKEFDLVNK